MKTLAIFGSTGSIGNTSLKILNLNKKKFKLLYLSAHNNYKKLKILQKKFSPKKIILTNKNLNDKFYFHDKGIILEKDLFQKHKKKIDYVISGVSGYEALKFNLQLLKISKNLLIANKETIICGGDFFLREAKKYNCNIIPVDSEQYCIHVFLKLLKNSEHKKIDKFFLIASGGPFLEKKIKYDTSVKNALKHPNWKMGKEISINSSTLANKVLELFEAKALFNIPGSKLKILIEKKSNVHVLIGFKNYIYYPVMHKPSMALPISDSLNLSNSTDLKLNNLNIKFLEPDLKKFPIVKLGYRLINLKSNVGAIFFTILNERLVRMFLNKEIKYGDISFFLVKAFKDKKIKKFLKFKIVNQNDIYRIINLAKSYNVI